MPARKHRNLCRCPSCLLIDYQNGWIWFGKKRYCHSYGRTEKILVKPSIESKFYIQEVDYFLNGEFIDSVKKPPFEILINLNIQGDELEFELKIKIYDSIGNSGEKQIILNIN